MHTLDTIDVASLPPFILQRRQGAEASKPAKAAKLFSRLVIWTQRELRIRRDRAKLAELDDHLLADVALTRGQIADAVRFGHPFGEDRSGTGYSRDPDVNPVRPSSALAPQGS